MVRQARQRKTAPPRLATLTVDPGFAALGWGVVIYEQGVSTCLDAGVITTKKATKKQRVLVNEDNLRRTRELSEGLLGLIKTYRINLMTYEAFSLPMQSNKSNLVKLGFPYAILATLSVVYDIAVVMSTPQHVKKKICGKNNASKEAVEKEMEKLFSGHPGIKELRQTVAASKHNHVWDALGAYVAAADSDVMRALKIGV